MAGYRAVADHVRRQIQAATLKPGDRLPPSSELVRTFRCSEITVRRACQLLELEGLVESVPRKGRFVAGADAGSRVDSKGKLIVASLRRLPPGAVAPSTGHLMLEFGASQATVRRAVRAMREAGELTPLPGGRLIRP